MFTQDKQVALDLLKAEYSNLPALISHWDRHAWQKTPDLVHGSRNRTELSAQMLEPLLSAAHASARVSTIRLANSGGVNTSSLERFAMHVNTSGLRPRSEKLA